MKKFVNIIISLLAVAACSHKADNESMVEWTFEATYTKASIGITDGAFAWKAGDAIAVWNQTGSAFVPFTTIAGRGKFSALAPANSHFADIAYYPASIATTPTTVALPAVYESTEAAAACFPMGATITEGDNLLSFKHLGALIAVNLANVPSEAQYLEISTPGKAISGNFEVASGAIQAGAGSGAVRVNLSLEDTDNICVLVPVPTGTYPLTIKVVSEADPDLFVVESEAAITFNRANLYSLETLDVEKPSEVIINFTVASLENFTLDDDGAYWE